MMKDGLLLMERRDEEEREMNEQAVAAAHGGGARWLRMRVKLGQRRLRRSVLLWKWTRDKEVEIVGERG